jgi:stringent starvation protein B
MDAMIKHHAAVELLGKGSVFIHLDPRVANVQCPLGFKQQPRLVLQVGLNMCVPIPDLRLDEDGIFGTLSFSRTPVQCFIPWKAIFALCGDDGRGHAWPSEMPTEVLAEVESEQALERERALKKTAAIRAQPPPPPPRSTTPRTTTLSGKKLPAGWRVIK